MSKLWAKLAGLLSSRTFVGMDKAGNRYFSRTEHIDGIMKEKRWVVFKGEQEPTSVPVEWICWLNGQRKRAPTPEELAELEARRERVRLNVALLKKEEMERKTKDGIAMNIGKGVGPDIKSFIRQFPTSSEAEGASDLKEFQEQNEIPEHIIEESESSEPSGSGQSFRPGTWQPPV